jgi:hypothetical protein
VIACARCNTPFSAATVNTFALVPCPTCKEPVRVDVYPAFFRKPPSGRIGDPLQAEEEAGCFYHPGKKVVVACSLCGRFLCALCDVVFNNRHLCPVCLETGKTKRKIKNLENHRVCYDKVALYIALIPMLFVWFTLITAPIVLFMVIRYWRAPVSIVAKTKLRFVLAFAIACLQIAAWILFFGSLIAT